jgi:hypothetical protein
MQPPAFGLPPRPIASPVPTEPIDRLLPRMSYILQSARQEMENVRTLLQASEQQGGLSTPFASMNPPAWRLEHIRQHIQTMGQNLNLVERGLGVLAVDAAMTNNPEVMSLRRSSIELREQLESLNRMMGQQSHAGTSQVPNLRPRQQYLPMPQKSCSFSQVPKDPWAFYSINEAHT